MPAGGAACLSQEWGGIEEECERVTNLIRRHTSHRHLFGSDLLTLNTDQLLTDRVQPHYGHISHSAASFVQLHNSRGGFGERRQNSSTYDCSVPLEVLVLEVLVS